MFFFFADSTHLIKQLLLVLTMFVCLVWFGFLVLWPTLNDKYWQNVKRTYNQNQQINELVGGSVYFPMTIYELKPIFELYFVLKSCYSKRWHLKQGKTPDLCVCFFRGKREHLENVQKNMAKLLTGLLGNLFNKLL